MEYGVCKLESLRNDGDNEDQGIILRLLNLLASSHVRSMNTQV